MAVDPKTGKPVAAPWPDGYDLADYLADPGVITGAEFGASLGAAVRAATSDRAPPPDAEPRGVSVPRGACGVWPAAREWAKAGEERRP